MRDKHIEELLYMELERQSNTIELIASENIVSQDVLEAAGSILTNKYSEGRVLTLQEMRENNIEMDEDENIKFSDNRQTILGENPQVGRRYYNGCEIIDRIELLACDRFRRLFKTDYDVNVQPHSGAQANMAVFLAMLKPGDTVLSMDLSNGGHLSHGSPVNFSGKYYNIISYGINDDGYIDMDNVRDLALEYKPNLIICGASNYSKEISFVDFADIRDELRTLGHECYLLADIAHIAGLVAGGVHVSPFPFADFVTTTTHKSLKGPRGGVIACKPEYIKKINSAVFPGMQGGPLEHIIAAKAVCFGEALQPEFKEYAQQIKKNAQTLCQTFIEDGFKVVGGMTQNHLMTLDLRDKGITGKDAANLLDKYGITVNKNTVPNDPTSPFITSGLRIGVPAVTTRGFKEEDMKVVGHIITSILTNKDNEQVLKEQKQKALDLCNKYPIYKERGEL